jgi:outer membrane protein TolC
VARAEAVYMQSAALLAEQAIHARSSVREGYAAWQIRYDVARHYRDEVVPLRRRIGNENLLRYNGMLVSVFELLADAREQIGAVNGYLDALRDFWLAGTDLQGTLGGRLPPATAPDPAPAPAAPADTPPVATPAEPADAAVHSHHSEH